MWFPQEGCSSLFPLTHDLAFNYRDLAHSHPATAYIWARHHWYNIELTGFLSLSSPSSNHSLEPRATKLASLGWVLGISKALPWDSDASQPMGSTVLHWNQNMHQTLTMSTLKIVQGTLTQWCFLIYLQRNIFNLLFQPLLHYPQNRCLISNIPQVHQVSSLFSESVLLFHHHYSHAFE